MPLHLHRATRTDQLADALGELLAQPLDDPFARELVVVPAAGVERWLSQRLSHRLGARAGDGVCAGIDLRAPWSLFAEITGTRERDPFAPERLTWAVLEALDASLGEMWAAPLARHLGAGRTGEDAELRSGRRVALAQRLAQLLAGYAAQRPDLLARWSGAVLPEPLDDPDDLPDDLAWQPPLWRAVLSRIDAPPPHERHAAVVAALRAGTAGVALPSRLSLFGHTRLSRTDVELLAALGAHREVHLWLPHPSPALWRRLAPHVAEGPVRRRGEGSHRLVRHPLLATLGRDVRELQRTLAVADGLLDEPVAADPTPSRPGTLLGWLQADLEADEPAPPALRAERVLRPDDRSVQVHACHGPARQVEVLREVLLGLLADDPTLEPRDVLVMCPDVEAYAPLVAASFGLADLGLLGQGDAAHPGHRLRVRLADRALTATNPLLDVVAGLLALADGRVTASAVLDLAALEPVRERFGLSDDDLHQLVEWVRVAGVRWGLDVAQRAEVGLGDVVANTWELGLDRLLTGVALSDDSGLWLDKVLPLDDVGSGQIELAGRLAELLARLRAALARLAGPQPLDDWLTALEESVASLATTTRDDAWQQGQLQRELARVREGAAGRLDVALRLSDVRALLGDRLGARPTRASFRTGTLTVCTMVPMRSVPHRVVCLLGLDDGAFPRVGIPDGDDVLAREPLTGERDPRSEDRQLLLDAVLAAGETLVVAFTGADEVSGQPRPPAVPLGELLDALDRTAGPGERGRSVSAAVTVRHPLQAFDPRNHVAGALQGSQAFSFDVAALAGARAAREPRVAVPALRDPLPPAPREDVALDDLLRFWADPAAGLLRQRLQVGLDDDDPPLDDALPVEIDALAAWSVGDRVLHDLLAGVPVAQVREQEWRRGVLPPRQLGWRRLQTIVREAGPIAEAARELRTRPGSAVDVDLDLGEGRRLRGTVPEVFGDRLVAVSYSRLGAKDRLRSWIRLLALTAGHDDHVWTAHTLGRHQNGRSPDPVGRSLLGPVDHTALGHLRALVALRDAGLAEPLPLPLKTSFDYVTRRRTRVAAGEALDRARQWSWDDGRFPGERSQASWRRLWPDGVLPGLEPPRPGEEVDDERTRFGALAHRLWTPLLDAEQGRW